MRGGLSVTLPLAEHEVGTVAQSTVEAPVLPGAAAWSAVGVGDRAKVGVAVVHGLTGNPNSTRPLGERLAEAGYTVEVPRLPGHGTDVKDMARTRYADWRAAVDAVVDDLSTRCEHTVLVGLSMGGTLVLDVASVRPTDVVGVVAINAQILDPDQAMAKLAPVLQHVVRSLPRDLAGLPSDDIAKPGGDEHAYARVPSKAAQSLISAIPAVRHRLTAFELPTLIAYSTQDHTVPPKNSRWLAEHLPGDVDTLVLEKSYHVATLDHDAELLEQAVLDFVARVGGV